MVLKNKLKESLGFTLIEVLMAMGALAIALPMGMGLVNDALNNMQIRSAASHFNVVEDAVKMYMKDKYSDIMDASGDIKIDSVAFDDLKQYVASGIKDVNNWGQGYKIKFYKTQRGLEGKEYNVLNAAIVTTGGKGSDKDFANKLIPSAAMRAKVGFVVPDDYVGTKRGDIQAADGTFAVNFADIGIDSPGQGHLGTVVSMEDLSINTQYVYRDYVPGHPELNSMNTDLNMGGGGTGGLGNPTKDNRYPTSKDSWLAQYGGNSINNVGSMQLSPLHGEVIRNSDGSIGGFQTSWTETDPTTGKTIVKTGDICSEANYDESTTADGKIFYFHTDSNKDPGNSSNSLENNFGMMMCRNGKAYLMTDTGNSMYQKRAQFVTDNELVEKPVCKHVGMKPAIYVTVSGVTSSKTNPQPILSYQSWAENYSDSQWRVRIRAKLEDQDANTWLDYNNNEFKASGGSELLRGLVTTFCAKEAEN